MNSRLMRAGTICCVLLFAAASRAQPPEVLWTQTYPVQQGAWSLGATPDGGFLLAGRWYYDTFAWYAQLTKVDPVGNLEWSRGFPPPGDGDVSEFHASVQTADGNIVAAGYYADFASFYHDVFAVKFTPAGDTLWTRTYDFEYHDESAAVVATPDGGCVITGITGYIGGYTYTGDVLLLKLDTEGNVVWQRSYGTPPHDFATDMVQDSSGNLFIAGYTDSLDGDSVTGLMMKASANGDSLWMHHYAVMDWTLFEGLAQMLDGSLVACGFGRQTGDNYTDVAVLRTDPEGNLLWQRALGDYYGEAGTAVDIAPNGDPIVFGLKGFSPGEGNNYVVRFTSAGDTVWTAIYDTAGISYCRDGIVIEDGGMVLLGGSSSGAGLIRTASLETDATTRPPAVISISSLDFYPNPFNSQSRITFTISRASDVRLDLINLLGQRVATITSGHYTPGEHSVTLNADGLSSGLYFVHLNAGDLRATQKVVALK